LAAINSGAQLRPAARRIQTPNLILQELTSGSMTRIPKVVMT